MKTYKPKTIFEAIDELETYLECDMYSKFRPEEKIKIGKKVEKFYRKDFFRNEKEFTEYLRAHFNILKKQLLSIRRKK